MKPMISLPFKPVGVAVILVAGIVAGPGLCYVVPYAHSRAEMFEAHGDTALSRSATQAQTDYHYASLLWPTNLRVANKLAIRYLATGQNEAAINAYLRLTPTDGYPRAALLQIHSHRPEQALTLINKLLDTKNDPEWLRIKAMALLEQGKFDEARDASSQAASYSLNNPDVALLKGLILATHGDNEGLSAYIGSLDLPGAAKPLARIAASKLALAQELYATGLPMSSQRVLSDNRQPQNAEYGILVASIALDTSDRPAWQQAVNQVRQTVEANPANVDLREAYRRLLTQLGNTTEADIQANLLAELKSQR